MAEMLNPVKDEAYYASLKEQRDAAARLLAYGEARDSLLEYIKLQMPDTDSDDPLATRYMTTPQARLLCEIMEKVERGEMLRVAVSIGPQMGKSEIITRSAPAWIAGRDPRRNIIVGTYNQSFAEEFGEEVRQRIQSPAHQAIFPQHRLRKGATDLLITTSRPGGKTAFVGVGGSGSGKAAGFFFVDDPIRNAEDADSKSYRDKVWKWFTGVVFARTKRNTAIVIVHTRWNTDDPIGRLCDPDHPERNGEYAGIADGWTYINLPAVIQDPDLAKALGLTLQPPEDPKIIRAFGTRPMAALWEEEKPLSLLAEAKILDPRTFDALYMGKPTPDEGDYFKRDWLVEYRSMDQLPKRLRHYGASDHAVSVKQDRDFNVIGSVGVDEDDDIWIMPDLVWERMQADRIVEELLRQFRTYTPDLWWLEDEMISKSFGPFLKKRMMETKTYVTLDPVTVSKDMRTRARAIQARMAQKKVHFPAFAPWWPAAKAQILQFDHGAHDDFVSFLSLIGQGLTKEWKPGREMAANDDVKVGSMAWILRQSNARARTAKRANARQGW